jgi:signal transduction histidine kinase
MGEPTPEALGKALARAGEGLSIAILGLESRAGRVEQAILADLARVGEELRQARRMADQLGSVATQEAWRIVTHFCHEMRTPLNAIVGWAELLRMDDPAAGRQAVEVIQRNAATLDRLLADMVAGRPGLDDPPAGRDGRWRRGTRE